MVSAIRGAREIAVEQVVWAAEGAVSSRHARCHASWRDRSDSCHLSRFFWARSGRSSNNATFWTGPLESCKRTVEAFGRLGGRVTERWHVGARYRRQRNHQAPVARGGVEAGAPLSRCSRQCQGWGGKGAQAEQPHKPVQPHDGCVPLRTCGAAGGKVPVHPRQALHTTAAATAVCCANPG
jgi:hypothetical protein